MPSTLVAQGCAQVATPSLLGGPWQLKDVPELPRSHLGAQKRKKAHKHPRDSPSGDKAAGGGGDICCDICNLET